LKAGQRTGLLAFLLGILGLSFAFSSPAHAQVSGAITIQNDDRFRGRSVSEGEPVAIASAGYDDQSGVYTGGSVAVTTNGDGIGVLRASAHIGYVQNIDRNVSLDTGAVINRYTNRYSGPDTQTFAEFYGGVSVGDLAFYAWYSPSYLDAGLDTLYLEANAVRDLGSGFRANARIGVLQRLAGQGSFGGRNTRYDAQVGLTKDFDRLSLSVTLGTAGPSSGTYFEGPWQGRDSIVVAATHSF
jgi:uncharacterized protein (TIGR02001 family)